MLSRKQFKLLKESEKGLPFRFDEQVKYLEDNGLIIQNVEEDETGHPLLYKCSEEGRAAIAEYRRNNWKRLPPWLTVGISFIALGVSIYALIQSAPST